MSPLFPHRFAAISCVAALLLSASASHAQETPAPPVPPVAPAAPPAAPDEAQAKAAHEKAMADLLKAAEQLNKDLPKAFATINKELFGTGAQIRGYMTGPQILGAPRLPTQTISLNVKNVPAREALEKILGEAKLNYVIDDDFPKDSRVSLSVSDVQVSTALDLVTQSAKVGWTTEVRDGKTIVRVGKKVRVASFAYMSGNAYNRLFPSGGAIHPITVPSIRWNGVKLPPTKISLDLKDALVREALIMLLEKQGLAYEIADDFPQEAKISIVLEDADLSVVLDKLTQSAGVRWVADKRDGKLVVRIGKKVVPDSFYYLYGGKEGKSGSVIPLPDNTQKINHIRIDLNQNQSPVVYQYQTQEKRSTFTCPRCGKKTTIVESGDKPGAKTAKGQGDTHNEHDGWHYCPYCGKKVSQQNAHFAAPLWDNEQDVEQNASTETGAVFMLTLPSVRPVYHSAFAPATRD